MSRQPDPQRRPSFRRIAGLVTTSQKPSVRHRKGYSRERFLSKDSTNSRLECKNILADSASLLKILSKSTLRPVLRKCLTIFLSAWNAWVLRSLVGFWSGTPRRIEIKFESNSLVIHWFSSSQVSNCSSPSKFNRRVLKWDSLPDWIYALGRNKQHAQVSRKPQESQQSCMCDRLIYHLTEKWMSVVSPTSRFAFIQVVSPTLKTLSYYRVNTKYL